MTAIYARWDKFALRREMAMVVERALRETLDGKPAAVAARTRCVKLRGGLQNTNWPTPYRTRRAIRVFTLRIRGWR